MSMWFLLNVCEKIEYQNPRVVMAMRDAVDSSTRNDYDKIEDLYKEAADLKERNKQTEKKYREAFDKLMSVNKDFE